MWLAWLSAFAVTQIIEAPIYVRALGDRPRRWAIALGASALTHPLIFLALPTIWGGGWLSYVLAAEAFAVSVEALWLARFGVRRAVLVALIANGVSTGVGLGLRALIGWP